MERPGKVAALLALAFVAACANAETIRVRDEDQVLFAARARATYPVKQSERGAVALGGELGGHTVHGDYGSPAGRRDYGVDVGYAAFVAEFSFYDVRVIPKVGLSLVDFDVEGQVRTVAERGLGGMIGVEARYAACSWLDLVARASGYARSSFTGELFEVGVELRPSDQVGVGISYASADHAIEDTDLFLVADSAEVENRGLLVGVTLMF